MKQNFIYLIFYLVSFSIYSQTVSGVIYDKKTNEVLPGASIYLNGTTVGVVSDFNGVFEININKITNTPLIISYTGFKTISVDPKDFNIVKEFYLVEESNQLKEVFLGKDVWSREKKIKIFKNEFLGKSNTSNYCSIKNLKDIKLIFNSATLTLNAYCDKPIIIKNRYLGYTINYNLTEFEVKFTTSVNNYKLINSVHYEGYSFFKSLSEKTKNKTLKRREKTYRGSISHFMRSLASKSLTEEHFGIYHERWPINPYKFLEVTSEKKLIKIEASTKELSILYNKKDQSKITFNLENGKIDFFIYASGNYSPIKALNFGGAFGTNRISDMLPLNYLPNKALELPETEIEPIMKINILN